MITMRARPCAPPPGRLCESPVWDSRSDELVWVDIRGGHIHRAALDPAAPDLVPRSTLSLPPPVSAVVPCASGGLVATAGDTCYRVDDDGNATRIASIPLPEDGIRRRLNDAKADPHGRLFAGTMSEDGVQGSAALYRLDPDGALNTVRTGVTISNGLDWSPDGTVLYYADSPTKTVEAVEYDIATGALGESRPFARFDDGEPDGLTVDGEGWVWVAVWGAGQVHAFDPTGRRRAIIEVGPSQASSCVFAGPDLDVLVITTAGEGQAADEPDAGRLFACIPGAIGLPGTSYADSGLVRSDGR
ncbi:sugar lactone lactonase YvrE [Nocardia tenerifensis]|uniref:Sugar lactone lactonase YvrE n=1 Tax=Nocardia tenerifensis TaxID=228006 RepID=A0A318JPK6_9NOCA|nr:SMP-30/gluconolactonase/LRE family protein [Nocardia tenerifensis]PXX54730.1 sugar lactone lactonase YvrE [Nocardia tenerifensis]